MSGGGFHDDPINRGAATPLPRPEPKRLTELTVSEGVLWADFSDGSSHEIRPRVSDNEVHLGCVKTTREALRLIQVAIEKEDKFQAENAERLTKQVAKDRKKVKA